MTAEHQYVPMPAAQTPRLRTTAELPFGIEEEVGVNVGRLHMLMQIAGIRHLKIENDSESKRTSKASMMIIGMNSQGGAYGGSATAEIVPPSLSEVEKTGSALISKQAKWFDLSIKLNVPEITQRILHSDFNAQDPQVWANELHKSLQTNILKRGLKHLLTIGSWEALFAAFLYSQDVASAGGVSLYRLLTGDANPHPIDISTLLFNLSNTGIFQTIYWSLLNGREKPGKGVRMSLFYGIEADRAILLLWEAHKEKLSQGLDTSTEINSDITTNS